MKLYREPRPIEYKTKVEYCCSESQYYKWLFSVENNKVFIYNPERYDPETDRPYKVQIKYCPFCSCEVIGEEV